MSNDTAIISLKEKIDDLNQQAWDVRVSDLPKSFELSQESVKLARSIDYSKGLAEGLRSLGFAYVRFSKNDEAAPLLKESLSLFQSLNDLKGQAVIYEYLGIIERNWGNLGASLDLLLKANEIILQTGPPELELTCSYQLGVTYKHLGNHENALDYLYKTLSLAKKINYPLMEAYATNIIGSIYFDNGNYNQALDCYQQGLPIRRQSHDKWGEAGSLDNIGFTYLKLNDLDKAIDHCKQSLAICQDTGDKKGEANALLHLGEIYEQAGDIKQAAGFSNESLEIRKARGDKRGETEVLLFLADLYKNRTDVEDHQIFEWLSDALKIADEIKAQDLLSKAYYNLHEYYQQKGKFKESLAQLEAHFQIEKELHKNSISQKIANLEISHKAEVISQRNKELTELNEKIEKANEELKIEASLERVRSRSMAMHKSEEVMDVAVTVYDELQKLDFKFGGATIIIMDKETGFMEHWLAGFIQKNHVESYPVNNIHHPLHAAQLAAWKKGEKFVSIELSGAVLKAYAVEMFTQTGYKNLPDEEKAMLSANEQAVFNLAYMSHGALMWAPSALSDEKVIILQRFAKVFEQTYTRFLDLQKAEAQAREAQIEAALERVRSKTMAMQRSEELDSVIKSVYSELKHLDVSFDRCFIMIFDEQKGATWWMGSPEDDLFHDGFYVQYHTHPPHLAYLKGWEERQQKWEYCLGGQIKKDWDEFIFNKTGLSKLPPIAIQYMKSFGSAHLAGSFENFGCMTTGGQERLSEESFSILNRFAKVFDQTYTRFNDLKQAEAQAREAKIEAALERVRSRSMAMYKSDELREVVAVLFAQLQHIGFDIKFCTIALIDKVNSTVEFWLSGFSQEILPESYHVPNLDHPFYQNFQNTFRQGTSYKVFELTGEEKRSYDKLWFTLTDFKNLPEPVKKPMMEMERVVLSCAFTKNGMIQIGGLEPLSDPDASTVQRFAKVFEQTYTRFLDLQKAEAQAREAQIEAALERVRSRTMAMQKSDELKDVIQVVYEQFVHLNVNVEHTGFIMDYKERNDMHIWLADKHAVPFQVTIPYFDCAHWNSFNEAKEKGIDFFANKLSFEEKNKFYQDLFKLIPDLPEETLEYYFSCPGLAISTVLLDNVGLYIENFSGISYSEEENATLMRFGKVFQQTYTRFNDLKLAEAHALQAEEDLVKLQTEKKRAEDALSELQVTQKQLIQSEKMASLGELTAGIAHEIQNPLNFVNNFSDVNKELLIEMKEEIERGNLEEVKIIANDIISNEEKINHHGKRADAIVKGMLQHSRSSSGVKEPTDINELADEYLRLAYHGLRAKDKSFNATMKTDFDQAIGKVNVIPQEIGRVFLNLITNAFYVVAEKKKQLANGYEPTVTVTTKKENGNVVVSVKDNGNGIPQKVLDKIFQPFFTTKPTGQGTGLGLSLSYDIVKAHSGEIKVKTKDGEGSEFVISLPV